MNSFACGFEVQREVLDRLTLVVDEADTKVAHARTIDHRIARDALPAGLAKLDECLVDRAYILIGSACFEAYGFPVSHAIVLRGG